MLIGRDTYLARWVRSCTFGAAVVVVVVVVVEEVAVLGRPNTKVDLWTSPPDVWIPLGLSGSGESVLSDPGWTS